jgi:hypothetical protein
MKDDQIYTDGGIGFNNPVLLLYEEALRILSSDSGEENPSHRIAYIVSIGTGKMPQLPTAIPTNIWWMSMIVSLLLGIFVGLIALIIYFVLRTHSLTTIGISVVIYVILICVVVFGLKNKPRLTNILYYTAEQVTDAHNTHRLMEKICKRAGISYFRFNPDLNARYDLTDTNHLDDWINRTEEYMEGRAEVEVEVKKLLKLFKER